MEELINAIGAAMGIFSVAIAIFIGIVWFTLDYKIEKLLNKVQKKYNSLDGNK